MRPTISQRVPALCLLVLFVASVAGAQTAPAAHDDVFARGRWHAEASLSGALELWNYNISHEELLGIAEGVTYGLRSGLLLTFHQRVHYVSQRANDTWLLGLTFGVRGRVYERGRTTVFLDGALGISDAAIATPPRGTRFNYLAIGGGGMLVQLGPRVHLLAGLHLMHISNGGLRGRGRNPDIEALGPTLGLIVGFR